MKKIMHQIHSSVDPQVYAEIKKEITSKDSVVGIDAVHTHILILDQLMKIEARLATLEEKLKASSGRD